MELIPFGKVVRKRMMMHDRLQFYEGPVRSGKTLSSLLSLLLYIEKYPVKYGLASGFSLGSLSTNVIRGNDTTVLPLLGSDAEFKEIDGRKAMIIRTSHGPVTIWCVGGGDAGSYNTIRGMTIDFWYADEVTRQHISFISEAMARLTNSDYPLMIWTSNPEHPENPIYKQYTDRYLHMTPEEKKEFGGYHEFHFTLWDNPTMTETKYKRLLQTYPPGFERERKVFGKRCVAEGLVFPMVKDDHFVEVPNELIDRSYVSIDFGVVHPTAIHIGGPYHGDIYRWHICHEWNTPTIDGDLSKRVRLDNEEIFDAYCHLCESNNIDPYSLMVCCDPGGGGASLIQTFQTHGVSCINARKGEIVDGIQYESKLLNKRMLTFDPSCKETHREFGSYTWDEKAGMIQGKDVPMKIFDDNMASIRYFSNTWIHQLLGGFNE